MICLPPGVCHLDVVGSVSSSDITDVSYVRLGSLAVVLVSLQMERGISKPSSRWEDVIGSMIGSAEMQPAKAARAN